MLFFNCKCTILMVTNLLNNDGSELANAVEFINKYSINSLSLVPFA